MPAATNSYWNWPNFEALGGGVRARPAPRKGRRAHNKQTLVEALQTALKGKTMSAGQAADAVTAAGYQSTSASIVPQVRIALARRKHFKRVARGQYTAK